METSITEAEHAVDGRCLAERISAARSSAGKSGFDPTPVMVRYAEACSAPEVPSDEESRCRRAGVSLRSFSCWRAKPGFDEWLQGEVQRRFAARAWEVWAVVHRLAREGNLTAAKLFVERFDPEAPLLAANPETFRELAALAADDRRPTTDD